MFCDRVGQLHKRKARNPENYPDLPKMLSDDFLVFHLWPSKNLSYTILFKIIARMKLLFSNNLGDCSYGFQGSSELIGITVTVSLFFFENVVTGNNSFWGIKEFLCNSSYMI